MYLTPENLVPDCVYTPYLFCGPRTEEATKGRTMTTRCTREALLGDGVLIIGQMEGTLNKCEAIAEIDTVSVEVVWDV